MSEFLLIATAHFLALLSPGQDFFLLIRTALRHGFRNAVSATLGITLSNAIWIAVAMTAVTRVRAFETVMSILQGFGALVLIYVGWCFLRAQPMKALPSDEVAVDSRQQMASSFALGFLSGISNPKNGVFYISLFSVAVASSTPLSTQIFYGLWMSAVVFIWDLGVSAAIVRPALQSALRHYQWRIEQGAGVVLIGLGLWLAFRRFI